MLILAFIFLVIAVLAAYYEYEGTNPTILLIAKIIMYFSVSVFFVLIISHVFSSTPPIPDDTSHRVI